MPEASDTIARKLRENMAENSPSRIDGWMFALKEGKKSSAELKESKLGGPYTPPSASDVFGGGVYIRWSDNTVSECRIKSYMLSDLDAAMKEWESSRHEDRYAPEIPEPKEVPSGLKIFDNQVAGIVDGQSLPLFETVDLLRKGLKDRPYAKSIDAEASAVRLSTRIMSSKGFDLSYDSTRFGAVAIVNDIMYDSYSKRRMPKRKELERVLKHIDLYMSHAQDNAPISSGKAPMIFMPDVLDSMIGKFILSNLNGGKIAENQSRFNADEFSQRERVLSEGLDLIIDGLEDYATSTKPCSVEGIPASKQYLIGSGRLITPLLDLKNAGRLGMDPTPDGDIRLESRSKSSFGQLVRSIKKGLLVYNVLGMHTQDPSEGRYSLPVFNALAIENGKIGGKVKNAVLAGDIFDHLNNKKTRFAEYRKGELAMKTYSYLTA